MILKYQRKNSLKLLIPPQYNYCNHKQQGMVCERAMRVILSILGTPRRIINDSRMLSLSLCVHIVPCDVSYI